MSRFRHPIAWVPLLGIATLLLAMGLALLPATLHAAPFDEPPTPPVYPGFDRTPTGTAASVGVISPDETLCKECEPDPEAVAPVHSAATGGPDEFGYTFIDSDEPGGPGYEFIDIRTTGTQVFLFDDSYTDAIPLGFEFPYYGEVRDEIHIGSNGLIGFAPDSLWSLSNSCPMPEEFPPNEIIALQWDDLYPEASGPILFQTFAALSLRRKRSLLDRSVHRYASFCLLPGRDVSGDSLRGWGRATAICRSRTIRWR